MTVGPAVRTTKRGICPSPHCGRSYQLTPRGVLQSHPEPPDPYARVRLAPMTCPGSGQPPKETR